MPNHSNLPVYRASYDFLLDVFRCVKNLNREYKYTVGETLKKETVSLLLVIFRANGTFDKRAVYILNALEHLETDRILIRILRDLGQLEMSRFVDLSKKIEIVHRQLAGWLKSCR